MYALLSYHYFKDVTMYRQLCEAGYGVLMDSGAYSAHTQGVEIDLDDYAAFAKEVEPFVERIFTLDAMGDPDLTQDNHRKLRAKGLRPIPVWQSHQWDGLDEFLDGEDWVALGSLVSQGHDVAKTAGYNEQRIAGFLKRVAGRARVHLLGYASMKWIPVFQPFSVDSTKCAMCYSFAGVAPIWDHRLKKWRQWPTDGKTLPDAKTFMFVRDLLGAPDGFTMESAIRRTVGEHGCEWGRIITAVGFANYVRRHWRTRFYFVESKNGFWRYLAQGIQCVV